MNLKQQLQQKLARAKQIRTSAEAGGRDLTAEEISELTALAADCKTLKAQIDQMAELDALDSEMNAGMGRKTGHDPVGGKLHAKAKDEKLEAMGGFESEAAFFHAVKKASEGIMDPRLVVSASDNMTNSGEYGFEIPVAISTRVVNVLEQDEGDLLSRVDREPTSAQAIRIPKNVDTPWNSQGLITHWENAGGEMKKSKLDATNSNLIEINPVSVRVSVQDDLIADAPRLASRLLKKAPEVLRWEMNEVIRNGDGVGKPMGYRNSKALITVDKESGQAAGTLTTGNIFAMLRHLSPAARRRAIWLINPDLEEELAMLKAPDGSLIFSSRDRSMASDTDGILKGRPVIWDEHAEEIGTAGDIQLIVPEGCYFAYRTDGPQFAQSMHVDFDQNAQAFRWRWRVGGGTFLEKPYSAAKSQNQRTHFIQLGARAGS